MKNSRAIFLLLLANSISGVAQGISMLAIPWYFTSIIHQEELFGKAYFTITSLSLIWGLYAGTLVDRYDRRKIFLVINLVGFGVLLCISGFGFVTLSLPWPLVALVFCTTAFIYNIHFPNLYAFAQEITPRNQYSRITSLLEIQGQFTFTLAGAAAAILLQGINHEINLFGYLIHSPILIKPWKIYEIFALDAVTYLASFLLIYQIQSLPVAAKTIDTSSLKDRIKTGVEFLKKRILLFHFGNASLFVFLTIIVFSTYLLPIYVNSFLHKSGDVYALGDMSFSMGALLAGFITTKLFNEKNAVRGIIALSIVAGSMYLLMSVNKILPLFFMANFVIGACNSGVRIQRVTYMFHHVPNALIGRTGSVFFAVNVFFRVCLIGVFTLPFFHLGQNIVYAITALAIVCFIGAIILGLNYKKLMTEPEIS